MFGDDDSRFGPVDGGRLDFTINGEAWALELPWEGRKLAAWAADGNWVRLVPGCIAPDYMDEFAERLGDPGDMLGLRSCWKTAMALSEDIYGVPWWTATELASTARASWVSFSSWAASHSFDVSIAPAHRIMSAALAWRFAQVKDEKEGRKLETKLFAPPKPISKRRQKSAPGFRPEEQAAAFQAALAALGNQG